VGLVTHNNESCVKCGAVCVGRVTHNNESCVKCGAVCVGRVTHNNESGVSHTNESCRTQVLSHSLMRMHGHQDAKSAAQGVQGDMTHSRVRHDSASAT